MSMKFYSFSTEVLQGLFNRSLSHIRKQGCHSVDTNEYGDISCRYRSEEGKGCAAAPFIKRYSTNMERKSFTSVAVSFPTDIDANAFLNVGFVEALQYCHDSAVDGDKDVSPAQFLARYEHNMKELAKVAGLSYEPPTAPAV